VFSRSVQIDIGLPVPGSRAYHDIEDVKARAIIPYNRDGSDLTAPGINEYHKIALIFAVY